MSLLIHRHHDVWGTIVLTPSKIDLVFLLYELEADNKAREKAIAEGLPDPGRADPTTWFEVRKLSQVMLENNPQNALS